MLRVNITIPVFNAEAQLSRSVDKLYECLSHHCRFEFELIIADNGSTDRTAEVAATLERIYPALVLLKLKRKGRGGAIKDAWNKSTADILSYMDVDLSTDLH